MDYDVDVLKSFYNYLNKKGIFLYDTGNIRGWSLTEDASLISKDKFEMLMYDFLLLSSSPFTDKSDNVE
jgi:hypothetical protein